MDTPVHLGGLFFRQEDMKVTTTVTEVNMKQNTRDDHFLVS